MADFLENIRGKYDKKHSREMGLWKQRADKLFTPDDAVGLWEMLIKRKFVPDRTQGCALISPSANSATLELAMWRADSQMRASNFFLVGDISDINPNSLMAEARELVDSNHRFEFARLDARNLLVIKDSVFDVVFDRKGASWHSAELAESDLVGLFQEYYRVLKDGGSLVLDATEGVDAYVEDLASIASNTGQNIQSIDTGQHELSTVDRIDYFHGLGFWKKLTPFYTIHNFGSGKFKTRVLIKRSSV